MGNKKPVPPKAEMIKKELKAHGQTRVDNYYWLNDRENPDVISYLDAENDYTDAVMGHTVGFRKSCMKKSLGG